MTPAFGNHNNKGLTKREYFAVHIAAALCSRGVGYFDVGPTPKLAVEIADALLEELRIRSKGDG